MTYKATTAAANKLYNFTGTLTYSIDREVVNVGGVTSIRVGPAPQRPPTSRGGGGGGPTTPANRAPAFDEGSSATRSVAENSAPGTAIGSRVTATDRDGDTLTYSLSGTDASLFNIDSSNGQISVARGTALDFEAKNSYAVDVRVTDPDGSSDTIDIIIRLTNVDEAGEVTLSTQQPRVGTELTAALTDPDGSVSNTGWTWEHSADNTTWTAIAGARSNTYRPVEADAGRYLRASATYTDAQGGNKRAEAMTTALVTAPAATPTPTETPTPSPTATPTPIPAATATSTPRPTATSTPRPTATSTPEPTATPTLGLTATVEPTAAPVATATPEAQPPTEDEGFPVWAWAALALVFVALVGIMVGIYLLQKRRL
ncbi:MAG: cadherin domain-containing protein [Chloroflexi bacterium]|nr:cadherin domain-containing protein [Chloroflexota bacterium]